MHIAIINAPACMCKKTCNKISSSDFGAKKTEIERETFPLHIVIKPRIALNFWGQEALETALLVCVF